MESPDHPVQREPYHHHHHHQREMHYSVVFIIVPFIGYITTFLSILQSICGTPELISPPPTATRNTQECVSARAETQDIEISISISLLTLISMCVACVQIGSRPDHRAVLERYIIDLYDHIGYVTIPLAFTYYYLGSISPSASLSGLYLIRSGNFLMAFLHTLVEEFEIDPVTVCVILDTSAIFSTLLDLNPSGIDRVSVAIYPILWFYKTSRGIYNTIYASKLRRRPINEAKNHSGDSSNSLKTTWQKTQLAFLTPMLAVSLYHMLKPNNPHCICGAKWYQLTYSQAVLILAPSKLIIGGFGVSRFLFIYLLLYIY
ncbi:hypothetical protein F4806DRAFT_53568 [Annulohypoxylon nitens]|nr:hypothetical protein F4806DRAFT_53568 [Annulohypoxylon nitens]